MKSRSKRIVVALRMAGIAGQDKLNGIFEHLSAGNRWQLSIYRTQNEFTAETVRHEIALGVDGFIVGIPNTDDALRVIARTQLPTVLMNIAGVRMFRKRAALTGIVKSDSQAVGNEGAAELLREGVYRSYGYAGYRQDPPWSVDRGLAFQAAINAAGFPIHKFDQTHFPGKLDDRATLTAWLKGLPKPCGILAACDDRAYEILDACREAHLKVPSQIGVLGINNDPILCENAEPRLSSIQPDFVREGRLAAEMLSDMIAGHPGETITVGIHDVVHRESTYPQSKSGRLIQKALAYITKNAIKGIHVRDVAQHLRISESLLSLRFRELQHTSVYATIIDYRLNEVKSRLRSTDQPIDTIATECGWENATSLKNLFLRRYGFSMREYRNRQR